MSIVLGEHQRIGIKKVVNIPHTGIFFSTGSGKSSILLYSAYALLKKEMSDKCVIVGTPSAIISLYDQLNILNLPVSNVRVESESEFVSAVLNKKISLVFMKYSSILSWDPKLYVINSNLQNLNTVRIAGMFDEVHKVKGHTSELYKRWFLVTSMFSRMSGYTATPITSNLLDLYNILHFLRINLFMSREQFIDRFVERRKLFSKAKGRYFYEVIGFKNVDQLLKLIEPNTLFFSSSKHLDIKYAGVPISTSSSDYELASQGLYNVDEDDVKEYGVRMHDLQQIVNKDYNKLALTLRFVLKNKEKGVVIFTDYYSTVDALCKLLESVNIFTYIISGSVKEKDRNSIKNDFLGSPSNKVLIITRAGGESLNLQSTDSIVVYDLPRGIGALVQVIGRVNRMYSKFDTVNVFFPYVTGTIDEYRIMYIQKYKQLLDKMFDGEIVPTSMVPSFNRYIFKKLRDKFLWGRS